MITLVDQLNATSPGNHHGWLGFEVIEAKVGAKVGAIRAVLDLRSRVVHPSITARLRGPARRTRADGRPSNHRPRGDTPGSRAARSRGSRRSRPST